MYVNKELCNLCSNWPAVFCHHEAFFRWMSQTSSRFLFILGQKQKQDRILKKPQEGDSGGGMCSCVSV